MYSLKERALGGIAFVLITLTYAIDVTKPIDILGMAPKTVEAVLFFVVLILMALLIGGRFRT